MRKLINILLILVMIINLTLVGCGNKQETVDTEEDKKVVETDAEEQSEGIKVDENLLNVEITLPSSIAGDMSDFNEEEYLAENEEIKRAKINEDGSLTLTMSKKKHEESINEIKEELESSLSELIESEETSYIKDVKYNKDFREVKLIVHRETYEDAFDLTPLALGILVGIYQAYAGEEYKTTIIIEDVETGEEIHSITYPDALED